MLHLHVFIITANFENDLKLRFLNQTQISLTVFRKNYTKRSTCDSKYFPSTMVSFVIHTNKCSSR